MELNTKIVRITDITAEHTQSDNILQYISIGFVWENFDMDMTIPFLKFCYSPNALSFNNKGQFAIEIEATDIKIMSKQIFTFAPDYIKSCWKQFLETAKTVENEMLRKHIDKILQSV